MDSIVEQIAKEVMLKLKAGSANRGSAYTPPPRYNAAQNQQDGLPTPERGKESAVLLTANFRVIGSVLSQIQALAPISSRLIVSTYLYNSYNLEKLSKDFQIAHSGSVPSHRALEGISELIVPAMSVNSLSKAANLIADTYATRVLCHALGEGVKIIVTDESILSPERAFPAGVAKKIHELRRTLEGMGVEFQHSNVMSVTPDRTCCVCPTISALGTGSGLGAGSSIGLGLRGGLGAGSSIGVRLQNALGTGSGLGAGSSIGVGLQSGLGTGSGLGAGSSIGLGLQNALKTRQSIGFRPEASQALAETEPIVRRLADLPPLKTYTDRIRENESKDDYPQTSYSSSNSAVTAAKMPMSGRELAKYIDHTLLKPNAAREEIVKLCSEAKQYGFASVCVNPANVALSAELLKGSPVKVCTVIGFPLGANSSFVKAIETRDAVANGADEIDMVINVGALKSKDYELVKNDIARVIESAGGNLVKVIIETSLLTNEEKVKACELAKLAGADYVKTSTGFSSGGATAEDVALMRKTVGPSMGVKASGGIRDTETALKMINSGATRIGASASVAIVKGAK